jgi:potassium voltage-gated channel Shal-related subfamily D member 2
MALIIFSALVTVLETRTIPSMLCLLPGGIWFGLETSLVALFTVEYVARCAVTRYSWSGLFGWASCALAVRLLQVFCPLFFF